MGLKAPNFSGLGANTITVGTIESQDATSIQINLGDDAGDDFIVDTNKLVVEGDNGRVGIGTAAPGGTLGIDGDIHFQPTAISTSHITTAGSLRIRATNNMHIGDDGVDSIRLGRTNTTAVKVHLRSGADDDLVVTNSKVGIGTDSPATALEVDGVVTATGFTIGSAAITEAELEVLDGATLSTTELNYVDGVTSAIQTQLDGKSPVAGHSSIATVGTITSGTWQGTAVASAYLDSDTAHLSGAQTFTGTKTLNSFKGTGAITVTNILDEDAMGTNSDTALATQQSIKAYADTKGVLAGSSSITTVGTVGTGTWQGTAVASAYLDADTAHLSGTQTFTGTKTLNSFKGTGTVTVTNILDEDAMGTNSDTALATQQSIKAYADTKSPVAGHSSIATVGTIGTGTWQGTVVASAYLDTDTAHLSGTQTFTGAKTFSSDVVISGTTPTLTIGDAGAEDTMLVFDGNAVDYRMGLDDSEDLFEIGVGATHGTTAALLVTPNADVELIGTLGVNALIADESSSGIHTMFTAGEALVRGEVVYFKAGDSKMWKAVATASATSRCVAMAADDIAADAVGKFLLQGFVRDNGSFPAFTVGATLFTPEAETASQNVPEEAAPDSDGDFVQVLGWAVTADMVYFNPSNDIIEVA